MTDGVLSTTVENVLVTANKNTDVTRVKLYPKAGMSSIISSTASSSVSTVISDLTSSSSTSTTQNILYPLVATSGLLFPYRPTITWNQQVQYGDQNVVHTNQDFRYYIKTKSVSFNITAEFTADNTDTAAYTMAALHFLRSVSKMHFGESDTNRGLPPPVLVLDGYGKYMMNKIPVILENFSMTWDNSVDWIKVTVDSTPNWIPVYCQFNLMVTSQPTPSQAIAFNYSNFANGSQMKSGGYF